jgi:hypothetical protein
MFFEWKSGDVTISGMKPYYYVLKTTSSTGALAAATNAFVFGPVIERVLPCDDSDPTDLLDLDSGNIVKATSSDQPAPSTPSGVFFSLPLSQLIASTNLAFKPVDSRDWDLLTAPAASVGISKLEFTPAARREYVPFDQFPKTIIFKTRAGNMGILQITGLSDNPLGAQIRYRLIKSAPSPSGVVNGFDPAIERTVTLGEVNPDGLVFVNLQKGEVMASPFTLPVNPSDPDIFERNARIDEWIETSGVDLALQLKSANWGFVPLNTRMIYHQTGSESPDYFEQLSSDAVRSVIKAPESTRDYVVSLGGGVSAYPTSASYIFKTRKGALGVLNIIGFTNNPSGVKIRYKLVHNAPGTDTKAPQASAETWSPPLAPNEKPDLSKIRTDVQTLMDQGQYEEALQRQIWYFNHALQYGEANPVRLSFGIMNWAELGRRFPKAKQAMIEIRDRDAREFSEGRGYPDLFLEITSLNRELQEDDATLGFFKTIHQQNQKLSRECFSYVEDLLIQKGEYELYLNCSGGDPQASFDSMRQGWEAQTESWQRTEEMRKTNPLPAPPWPLHAFTPPDMGQLAASNFVGQVRELVESLVATGNQDEAEKIRDQAVALLDDPRLKSAVTEAERKLRK